jgi:hypothetical protein
MNYIKAMEVNNEPVAEFKDRESLTEEQLREKSVATIKKRKSYARYASYLAELTGAGFTPSQVAYVLRMIHNITDSRNGYGTAKSSAAARESVELLISELPQTSPLDRAAVLIMLNELEEWVKEELEELMDEMPPDGVVENLVDKLAQHFGNDLGQWIADNLKSFFNRDDVLKVVE